MKNGSISLTGVELCNAILGHNLPKAPTVRMRGNAFKENTGCREIQINTSLCLVQEVFSTEHPFYIIWLIYPIIIKIALLLLF